MAKKNKWSLDLKKYAKAKGEQIDEVRKVVAETAFTNIVQRTPVDTGRAKGNWQIGINRDEKDILERFGDFSLGEIAKLTRVKGDETIYISNNLPYIVALEYGHSKKSPNGMVDVTFAELKMNIDKFVKETEKKK